MLYPMKIAVDTGCGDQDYLPAAGTAFLQAAFFSGRASFGRIDVRHSSTFCLEYLMCQGKPKVSWAESRALCDLLKIAL